MGAGGEDAALVLFSGGQDSTVCLAWALERYARVETVGFAYGQRHAVELECRLEIRRRFAARWGARLGADCVLDLTGVIAGLGETALTGDAAIALGQGGLPNTFVPGRNLLFLAASGALAWRRGVRRIVGGMCETDFSGYPDCRDDTIKAMQVALNLGLEARLVLETPLMWVDKAGVWGLAEALGVVDVVVECSHSCYLGDRSTRWGWGFGCGGCPACALRARGWERWRGAGVGEEGL